MGVWQVNVASVVYCVRFVDESDTEHTGVEQIQDLKHKKLLTWKITKRNITHAKVGLDVNTKIDKQTI